jgi:hypothetical protein
LCASGVGTAYVRNTAERALLTCGI